MDNSVPVSQINTVNIIEQNISGIETYVKIYNDSLDFKQRNFKEIVANLLSVKKEDVEFEDKNLAEKILTIHYKRDKKQNSSLTNSSRSIVLFELLTKYNLKIDRKTITKEIYLIQIVDSMKLNDYNHYQKDSLITGNIPIFLCEEIILHNANLNLIAKTISVNYGREVISPVNDHNQYTLKIPKLEFNELNRFMIERYGIKFKKSSKDFIVYRIRNTTQ